MPQQWIVLLLLIPLTVVELSLIHLDRAPAPRCINVLDLNTKHGECSTLLASGEFSCEHDFCPDCTPSHEGFQAHECDLACGFCPEFVECHESENVLENCVNRLDEEIEDGTCDMLISEGHFSCERDFCSTCEGLILPHAGEGVGGHQRGECDRSCGICQPPPVSPSAATNCTTAADARVQYLKEVYAGSSIPSGYVWTTPASSEFVATVSIVLFNSVAAMAILCQGVLKLVDNNILTRQPIPSEQQLVFSAVLIVIGALVVVAYSLYQKHWLVLDLLAFSYTLGMAAVYMWGSRSETRFQTKQKFYPAAVMLSLGPQFVLVMMFLGFDYCIGLAVFGIAFALAALCVLQSTPDWLAAPYFRLLSLIIDGACGAERPKSVGCRPLMC